MKRANPPVTKAPPTANPTRPHSLVRPLETESVEQIGWGDSILKSLRTRLFHGFRPDFKHNAALWAAATRVIVHAIRTFGSEEKAYSWLTARCGALSNESPYDLLKAGKADAVDEELDRIDYGVYV